MSLRPAAVAAALAVLVAVPACKKQEENPDGIGMDVRGTRGAALRMQSQNNLKQIALALFNYESANTHFPVGVVGPDGKTLGLSWRVAILPYIEHDPLYRQFRLNEPWDSEHNKKLIPMCPKVFSPPGVENPNGLTFYRGFSGREAFFHLDPSSFRAAGQLGRGRRINDLTDGTSNTFGVAEAAEPVIWTKPDELAYDPKGPVPKLGGIFREFFQVAFIDGSVRSFQKDELTEQQLRALITVNGGEVIRIP
jgi:hypothetical protein